MPRPWSKKLQQVVTLGLAATVVMPVACARGPALTARADSGTRPSPPAPPALPPLPPMPAASSPAARGTQLALLYSSNLRGEYEHCGCPEHPIGGLVRLATFVDRARAESDGVLIVDAGDMLLPAETPIETFLPPLDSEIERRARVILGAYARMGAHAVLPAEGDLRIGPARLRRLLRAFHIPAVASNLADGAGRPFFERDRLITIAGVRVGIFGVVMPQKADQALWDRWRPMRAADPTSTARAEVASLRARGAQMIVALVHLGAPEVVARFLREVPGITWAVAGHVGAELATPEAVGGARLLEAASEGRLAGRLDIHVVDGGMTFTDRGERAQLLAQVDDGKRQLVDNERRAAEDLSGRMRDFYVVRRKSITDTLVHAAEAARKLPAAVHGSWYENRIVPLDESFPDHPGVAQLVAAYNAENTRRAAAGLPVGVEMRDPHAPAPAAVQPAAAATPAPPGTYAGSVACAGCHERQWRFFQTTKHAHALAALAKEGRDRDPTCVGCHTTGFLLPGGTANIAEATDRLQNVGCESCHGPGLEHVTSVDKKSTTHLQVEMTTCLGCHTADRTNGEFDYERFRRAILGPGHGA
ncbi:MAG: multiheme c-type cytochrome [Pseudomonadota bacterium]